MQAIKIFLLDEEGKTIGTASASAMVVVDHGIVKHGSDFFTYEKMYNGNAYYRRQLSPYILTKVIT